MPASHMMSRCCQMDFFKRSFMLKHFGEDEIEVKKEE